MSALTGTPEARSALDGIHRFGAVPEALLAAADDEHVRVSLHENLDELRSGEWTLEDFKPRVRLKRDASWHVDCAVRMVRGDAEVRNVNVTGELLPAKDHAARASDPPAFRLVLRAAPEEGGLPGLPFLVDPTRAHALLQESLRRDYPGVTIAACVPEVMRFKPGSRCTLRFRMEYAPHTPPGPGVVVAKAYRGDKGANAYAGMAALSRAGISDDTVALAKPFAYLPELRVLVQGPVAEEETLKALLARASTAGAIELDRLTDAVSRAAAGLAAVHGSGVEHGEAVAWEDELHEVRALVTRLRESVVELPPSLDEILGRLEAVSRDHPADPPVATHGSFRPGQVLLSAGGRIAFIDFDGLCRAEPALDVAQFRASLRSAAMSDVSANADRVRMLGLLDGVCDHFLARYTALHPVSTERVQLWETLDLLTSLLHSWTKLKPDRLAPSLALLEHHLQTTPLLR
jgi:hypothetical protein